MTWNPESYLAFADHRTRPALDLLARLPLRDAERVVTPLDDLRSSTPRNQPEFNKLEFNKLFPASEGLRPSPRHRARRRSRPPGRTR